MFGKFKKRFLCLESVMEKSKWFKNNQNNKKSVEYFKNLKRRHKKNNTFYEIYYYCLSCNIIAVHVHVPFIYLLLTCIQIDDWKSVNNSDK